MTRPSQSIAPKLGDHLMIVSIDRIPVTAACMRPKNDCVWKVVKVRVVEVRKRFFKTSEGSRWVLSRGVGLQSKLYGALGLLASAATRVVRPTRHLSARSFAGEPPTWTRAARGAGELL